MAHDPWPGQSYDEDENSRYGVSAKIMLSAFICLLAVVLFVILLHLYARCYLRRHFLSHHHRTLPPPTPATHFPTPPKTGLDPPTIASLPTFLYTHHHTPTIECTVCLSHLEPGETVRLLPNCDHSFHVACIDMWLLSHSTCPVCRTPAEPRVAEPGTGSDQAGASAPPLDNGSGLEDGGSAEGQSSKGSESVSRLSSFRRILSRDRSERRSQASVHPASVEDDIERQ